MRSLRIVIGCGLLLCLTAGLRAQTSAVFNGQIQDIVKKTRFMIGPLRFYPLFKFSYFSWVSNIFGFTDTLRTLSDLVITPSPELTAYVVYKRSLILSFTENPEYQFFLTQSNYSGFTNAYRAQASVLLLNRFIVSGQYEYSTQRLLGYVELDRVVQSVTDGYTVQVHSQTARGTSLTLFGSRFRLTYQDVGVSVGQISPVIDRYVTMASAEVGYRVFSASQLFLRGSYSLYDFFDQLSLGRKSRAADIQVGLRFPPGGFVGGTIALGYKRFLPETQSVPGFSGLIGNVGVQFRAENLGYLDASFSRDIDFSLLRGFLYFVNTTLASRMTVRTTKFLFLRLGGSYSWLSYPPETPLPLSNASTSSASIRDHYLSGQAGIIVRLARAFGLGLTYQRWLRNSLVLGGDFKGSLVSIEIVHEF